MIADMWDNVVAAWSLLGGPHIINNAEYAYRDVLDIRGAMRQPSPENAVKITEAYVQSLTHRPYLLPQADAALAKYIRKGWHVKEILEYAKDILENRSDLVWVTLPSQSMAKGVFDKVIDLAPSYSQMILSRFGECPFMKRDLEGDESLLVRTIRKNPSAATPMALEACIEHMADQVGSLAEAKPAYRGDKNYQSGVDLFKYGMASDIVTRVLKRKPEMQETALEIAEKLSKKNPQNKPLAYVAADLASKIQDMKTQETAPKKSRWSWRKSKPSGLDRQ